MVLSYSHITPANIMSEPIPSYAMYFANASPAPGAVTHGPHQSGMPASSDPRREPPMHVSEQGRQDDISYFPAYTASFDRQNSQPWLTSTESSFSGDSIPSSPSDTATQSPENALIPRADKSRVVLGSRLARIRQASKNPVEQAPEQHPSSPSRFVPPAEALSLQAKVQRWGINEQFETPAEVVWNGTYFTAIEHITVLELTVDVYF